MARNRTPSDSEELEALLRQVAAAPAVEPSAELFPLSPGAVVGHTYRIEARIGVGGMGVVYRAVDLSLGRRVALKLHRRRPDPDRLDRLMSEASVMAKLSHPNVVRVFEVGHHREAQGETRLFVAMELVEGGSLTAWARKASRRWPEMLEVFVQAAAGLAAAHAAGIVHRDFKPDNVLIDDGGGAHVADFGLARLGPDRATHGDPPSAVLGTPAYMAPEQWEGAEVTAKSDQYAFCVSLYEMLYGGNPLAAVRVVDQSPDAEPVWTPRNDARVPTRIFRALRRGLARDPRQRFESMETLVAALRHDPWWTRQRLLPSLWWRL